jgi:hypothetical protein
MTNSILTVFRSFNVYVLHCSGVIVRLVVAEGEEVQVDHLMTAWVTEVEVVLVTLGMEVEVEVAGTDALGVCSRAVVRWTNRRLHLQSQLQSVA